MPIKFKSKIVLAKIETTYGVDPVPTGAANAVLAVDFALQPMEGQDVSRDLELPYVAAQASLPVGLHAKLAFKVELAPSGAAGTAPAWGPLLRACAVAQVVSAGVSVVYNPISDNQESVTLYFQIGGTRYVMPGTRGTVVLRVGAQNIPYLEFAFTGLFTIPTEQARPTPVLTGFKAPQVATKANTPTFTIDGAARVMRSFALDFVNDVQTRFLVGSESVLVVDRADAITTQIEAQALDTWDPYTKALNATPVALSLVHGTGAGKIATLAVPSAQIQRPNALANQQNILEWPLRLTPLPVSGNDQWTLTLT